MPPVTHWTRDRVGCGDLSLPIYTGGTDARHSAMPAPAPQGSPNPRGCPPIRTIFQSSPDALVNNKLLGNLERERVMLIPRY